MTPNTQAGPGEVGAGGGFTPGPWLLIDFGGGRTLVSTSPDAHDRFSRVAVIGSGNIMWCEQHAANARLIASAPDSHYANLAVLAALDEAFGIKATWDDERIYDELPSSGIARAYFMARAAIAKAVQP